MVLLRPHLLSLPRIARQYSTSSSSPRHFLSLKDLSTAELSALVRTASNHKASIKANSQSDAFRTGLQGQTVGLVFSKRSTRTRISSEGAVTALGGHAMFLGKDDIQLGVNETLKDTSIVMSSMMASIVARVNKHADVAGLAEYSSVPVINAMCDLYHPLQGVADYLTMYEVLGNQQGSGLGLEGKKICWIGDATNVMFDLCIGAVKLGIDITVANPVGYQIPDFMRRIIEESAASAIHGGSLTETTVPEEAAKDADIILTDTWVSMGQESEMDARRKAFQGYTVTEDLAARGGAKKDWKFMHCLPRHPGELTEVDDEVFYSPRRTLVWEEAQNRLWACIAALEGFVVNKGKIE